MEASCMINSYLAAVIGREIMSGSADSAGDVCLLVSEEACRHDFSEMVCHVRMILELRFKRYDVTGALRPSARSVQQ
jgi:hypothetical protein